ncbi:HAD-IC family P-type ATPase [Haloimpatiens sp. FM7330]|uniref:HAD-IC family P-type ATPase n=1 Tax=Haloimpatiens sp. FM7330 TaxID=3298610 RepID=UPI003638DF29
MNNWYNYSWNYVVKKLGSDIYKGLKEYQIEKSREEYGDNKIETIKTNNLGRIIVNQFKSLWFFVFIFSEFLMILNSNYIMAGVILILYCINNIYFITENYSQYKKLREIEKLNSYNVNVIRKGNNIFIPCEELVVGDIVYIKEGTIVPADLRIIESQGLKVNQAAITGENYVVNKYETKIEEEDIQLSEMKNMLFKSSYVVEGEGIGIVTAAGMKTEAGKIIHVMTKQSCIENIFNKRIRKTMHNMSIILLIFLIISVGVNLFLRKELVYYNTIASYIFVIFLTHTFIITINTFYSVVIKGLKKENIKLNSITSMYKLCDISIVIFDKIGSVSEKEMQIKNIYVNDNSVEVDDKEFEVNEYVERILNVGLLCNDAKYNDETNEGKGNLEDIELIRFCRSYEILKSDVERKYRRINEIPFDSDRKIMTTINKVDNNYRANVKGSVDYILERCTHIFINGVEREITKEDINRIKNVNIKMCEECLDVKAFATRGFNYEPSLNENIESNLVFIGLIGFFNPIKKDFNTKLLDCGANCMKPIITMEENKLTSLSIGKKLNLVRNISSILSGIEIEYMKKEELENLITKINILSKVNHKSKAKVAEVFKDIGYKIGMCGNKLKDLAYLVYCDVSIAYGEKCSNTIKNICDVYLDEFDLEKFLYLVDKSTKLKIAFELSFLYTVCISICECSAVFISYIFSGKFMFSLNEILWINLININILIIALLIQHPNINRIEYLEKLGDENYKKNIIIKSVLLGIIPAVVFGMLIPKGVIIASKCGFIILNAVLSLFLYNFTNKYHIFFERKLSNILIILNILLNGLIILI